MHLLLFPDQSSVGQTIEVLNPDRNSRPFYKDVGFRQHWNFKDSYELEINKDFFVKNEKVFLKPNEALDRNNISPGQYSLQFDFLRRLRNDSYEYPNGLDNDRVLFLAEISPSRKEIRLNSGVKSSTAIQNHKSKCS